MSGVDVHKVLGVARVFAAQNCEHEMADNCRDAALAVAELIEAAIEAKAAMDSVWRTRGRDDDFIYDELGSELAAGYFSLRAALANVTGGAA